ncbi:MAG: sugar phosphate nucleotidyltransferase [Candidatus Diapherotrites archaeon]
MKAVILAAGRGVRLRPLTEKIPKVMVKVKGKPLLEHVLARLAEAGIGGFEIVVGYRREEIEKHFGKSFAGVPVNYLFQAEQLGTAHAIALARGRVKGNFLVVNADVLVESALFRELATIDEFDDFDVKVVGRTVDDPWRYGVLVEEGGTLRDIVEKPNYGEEPGNLINAGIYRFNQKIFGAIGKTKKSARGEFEIVDSIKILMRAGGKVAVVHYAGACIDIGDLDDLKKANESELP